MPSPQGFHFVACLEIAAPNLLLVRIPFNGLPGDWPTWTLLILATHVLPVSDDSI